MDSGAVRCRLQCACTGLRDNAHIPVMVVHVGAHYVYKDQEMVQKYDGSSRQSLAVLCESNQESEISAATL